MTKGVIFFSEPNNLSLWGDIAGWTNILSKMAVDFYIVIDEHGLTPSWSDQRMESYRVNNFQEALDKLAEVHPECETIWFAQDNPTELKDFEHPVNACYVFGADSGNTVFTTANHNVKLYSANLWAVNCCCVALYDRLYSEVP